MTHGERRNRAKSNPRIVSRARGTTSAASGARLTERVQEALRAGRFLSAIQAKAAAFHLTDWVDELYAVARLFNDPRPWTDREAQAVLLRFVVHASAHVAAAHRIIAGSPVTDVFELGAVQGSGRLKGSRVRPARS